MTTRRYSAYLTCSEETKKNLMGDCIELFLEYHPEMKGITITQGFILEKVVEFYTKED